jgi:cytochrome c-type protein NapC
MSEKIPDSGREDASGHVSAVWLRVKRLGRSSWGKTARVRVWLVPYWSVLLTPSRTLSLGFLTIGGFLAGILFWGGFNTALEATNTEKFCVSCHEMRENVFAELKSTIHYSNRSGVRATCPDCHVPHEWTHKIGRKIQASKEVWGKIFGTISTREKFLDMRLTLAQHEWARLKANDSLECRNCHSAESMDISRQSQRPAAAHQSFLFTGQKTCIDCHKGIAHRLPRGAYDFGLVHGAPRNPEVEALRAYIDKNDSQKQSAK